MAQAVATLLKTDWKFLDGIPDEDVLREQDRHDAELFGRAFMDAREATRKKMKRMDPLFAAGVDKAVIDKMMADDRKVAIDRFKKHQTEMKKKPAVNVEKLHKLDVELAKTIAAKITPPPTPTFWSGYLMQPYTGGWWGRYNGESEEKPSCTIDVAHNRFDPKAQAFGEGWYDRDYSEIHAFLAFRFNPPSWGHLHVYAYPWIHGYSILHADDSWYKSEYASANVSTWIDVHQNFWRTPTYNTVFSRGDDEIDFADRIDRSCAHGFHTNVGENDAVVIRVGVRLRCDGKANGGRARLDFHGGQANYVQVPYVRWTLTR